MRHTIVLVLALVWPRRPPQRRMPPSVRLPAGPRRPRRCRRRSSSSRAAATGTASVSTSTAPSAQAKANRSYRDILAFYYPGTELGKAPVSKLRVLIADGRPTVKIASSVPFSVRDGSGSVTPLPAGRARAQARSEGRRRRQAAGARRVRSRSCPGRAAPLTLDGKGYRGELRVTVVQKACKGLQVIDVVGLDAYLLGVVPGEMPKEWPAAALQAQAVAARSYALASLVKNRPFDLYCGPAQPDVLRGRGGVAVDDRGREGDERRDPHLRRQGGDDVLLLVLRRPHRRRARMSSVS